MSNIEFGLWMTVMGMGTVFLLLILLWVVLKFIGAVDQRSIEARRKKAAAPIPVETTPAQTGGEVEGTDGSGPQIGPDGLTDEERAAVTVAVVAHARMRRLQGSPEARSHSPGSHLFASRWVGVGRANQRAPWTRGR